MMERIPVYKPYLPPGSLNYAYDALNSGWLSHGPYVRKATEKLQKLLNHEYILLVNNGTSAVHLCALALKKFHPKIDTIITGNNHFVAGINGFLNDDLKYNHWLIECQDANRFTWNPDFKDCYSLNHNWAALLVIHNLSGTINVPALQRKYSNLVVVSDCAEAFGAKYEGKFVGTTSFAAAYSFFGNKNFTCGEGGMFLCQSQEVLDYVTCVHGQGQGPERFEHYEKGHNYRIPNIQAAILLGQLEMWDEIRSRKERLFEWYRKELKDLAKQGELTFQDTDPDTTGSNWMFGIRCFGSKYQTAQSFFDNVGIETRKMFLSFKNQPYLQYCGDFHVEKDDNAKLLNQEVVVLPSYPDLTKEQVSYICSKVHEYVATLT